MKIADIKLQPTVIVDTSGQSNGFHESLLRSYQILEKVKELLRKEVAPSVVLEIIEDIEATPSAPPYGIKKFQSYEPLTFPMEQL